jgi:hypothetical protein
MSVTSTPKTTNLDIGVSGELSVDEMQTALTEVASEQGLYLSHITTLGTKRYPGNRHWHLKRRPGEPGCLDVTYWPAGPLMWVSIRNYEPQWVHDAGQWLVPAMETRLAELGG